MVAGVANAFRSLVRAYWPRARIRTAWPAPWAFAFFDNVFDKDNGTAIHEVVTEFLEPITNANVCMKDLSVVASSNNDLRNFNLTITNQVFDKHLFKFIAEFKIRTSEVNTGSAAVTCLVMGIG